MRCGVSGGVGAARCAPPLARHAGAHTCSNAAKRRTPLVSSVSGEEMERERNSGNATPMRTSASGDHTVTALPSASRLMNGAMRSPATLAGGAVPVAGGVGAGASSLAAPEL